MRGRLCSGGGSSRGLCGALVLAALAVLLFVGSCVDVVSASASVPSTAIRYFYTPSNRLSAVVEPEAEYAFYTWDAAGNLSSIKRASSTKLSIIQLEPTGAAVGETVDIWGTGFSTTPANDTVEFNGTVATVTAATANALAVKVPSGATSGTVTVQTTSEGPVTSLQSFTVSSSAVPGVPTITSLSVSAATAGTVVTISGTNFETHVADDYVLVNETLAEVTSATSTSLKFVVPEAAASGRVAVSTPYGSVVGPYLYVPLSGYTTAEVGPTASLTFNSASALNITAAKSVGYATVEANGGERLSAVLKSITISSGTVYVYAPHGEEVGSVRFYSGEEVLLAPVSLPTTGVYTLLVVPDSEGTGKIEITPYYAGPVGGTLTPTVEGVSRSVSLPSPGEKAEYMVSVTAGEEVTLKVSEFTLFSKEVDLEWFTFEGGLVKEHGFSGNGVMGPLRFATAGTYRLVVNPNGINTGSLKLTAYTAVTGSIIPTTGGESKTVTTSLPYQYADITFSANAGEELSLLLSESTYISGNVAVFTPEGLSISGSNVSLGSSTVMDGPNGALVLPMTGTYTIQIAGSGEDTGSVKLTAYKANQATGSLTPSPSGASENVSLLVPDQKAKYTISATAGEEVSLKVSEFSFSEPIWLEWFNPRGEDFKEKRLTTNGFMETVTLSTTGTYYLAVNPNGLNTGSLKLSAYSPITGSITPSSGGESETVTTNAPGQNARIAFSGKSSEEVSLVLSESTFKSGTFLIENSEGSRVGEELSFGSSGEATLGPVSLPTTGTYTILIKPGGESSGSVKLTAYTGSPPHGLVIRRGPEGSSLVTLDGPDTLGPIVVASATTPVARPAVKSSPGSPRKPMRHEHTRTTAAGAAKETVLPAAVRSFRPDGSGAWAPQRIDGHLTWSTGQPASPWADLAPLAAAGEGATALAGQALKLNGMPLAGVHLAIEDTTASATTDARGQFVLSGLPAGHQVLEVQGGMIAGRRYGALEIGVKITAHVEARLEAPIWMTPLDPAGNHHIASPTHGPVTLTTPKIPGLEVRLPAGTVIHNDAGQVVHELNITPIPVDRPPFPLPLFDPVPLYFTIQPGGAYLSKGAQIIYPNDTHLPAGERVPFWNYEAGGRGWYVYGYGTVSANGKQVVPDPGVEIWELTGAMYTSEPKPPHPSGGPGTGDPGGDPVNLGTGLFEYRRTDLVIPDTIPIVIERTYRQEDSNSYSFGKGTASLYDMRMWSENNYHEVDLVLPNGGTVLYKRVSPGEGYKEAEYTATNTPSVFYDSKVTWNESLKEWDLTLTNGMTYVFGELAPLQAIRNRQGQQLTITRSEGQKGNIVQITSPHGRWVKFTYNGSNDITEIKDNGGRTLKYTYKEGLLESATDPAGRTTKYEYNASGEMTGVTDPRGNKYIETEYETHGRVSKQKMANGGVFEFSYTTNGEGNVESTTVTEPRENKRKVTFNSEGYETSETRALGTAIEQKTTFERQANTGFLLSSTDPRSRKTSYEYDSYGNVTAITHLAARPPRRHTNTATNPKPTS
jgi:YD repeat-containing protein